MKICSLFALMMVASLSAFGAWVPVSSLAADEPPIVQVTSAADGWNVRLDVPGVNVEASEQNPQLVQRISLAGDAAELDVPAVNRLVALRQTGAPELQLVSEDWYELDGVYDASSEAVQALDAAAGQQPYTISPRQIMGGVALAIVHIQTARYDAQAGRINVLRSVNLRVRETGSTIVRNRPITESNAELLRAVVANWEQVATELTIVRGTYLYILAADSLANNGIQELIKWRKRKGHTVETAGPTAIGTLNTTNIKTYIQNRYNAANPPLEYVCLVGDAAGSYNIPAYTYTLEGWSGCGDWDYTRLDGNDILPDVQIGRFCFGSSIDLALIVNRTLRYERTPSSPSGATKPDWYLGGGCFAGSSSSGVSTIHTMRTVRARMLDAGFPSTSIDTAYYHTSTINATVINNSINSGVSLWCYRGYIGMSNYQTTDVSGLNNVSRWPFMMNLTCSTNDYNSSTNDQCEAFMLCGTPANPTGAVAIVGMSSSHTNTRYNNALMTAGIQGMLTEGIRTTGAVMTRAKLEIYRSYPEDSAAGRIQFFEGITNLLGDPALDVFTGTPDTLFVNNAAQVPVGTNSLALTVTNSDGQPVPDAYVNLLKGSEVFTGGWTSATGQILLSFTTTSPETLFVTATKHNFAPALNYTLVVNSAQYVSPSTISFSSVVPGQAAQVTVPLKNSGSSIANAVSGTISSTDPFVAAITNATVSYGNIAAATTVTPAGHYDFTVASYAPDGYVINFTLTVTDNASHTWTSTVPVRISNGNLSYTNLTISGEGNGILDPGESGLFSVTLVNSGTRSTAAGATGYLRSLSTFVTVTDSVGAFSAATPAGTCSNASNLFGVTATSSAFPGETARFMLRFPLASGFADTVYFGCTIGSVASTSPTPPDAYGYRAFDDTDVGFAKHPVFNWVEIDSRSPYNGPGTVAPIIDDADQMDTTVVVNLPFTFRYYGQDFTQISVCSNGWLAMGADQAAHKDFRNYAIPTAIGARRMISPFWDDLRINPAAAVNGGDRGVHTLDQGNDACPATVIPSVPYTDNGSTAGRANDYAPTCYSSTAPDVIYQYTPDLTDSYIISLCGSSYDTGLLVRTGGACPGANVVACNDDNSDFCSGNASYIQTTLTAGTTYYIIIDGWSTNSGNYILNLSRYTPPAPAGVYTWHDAANHRFIIEWSRVGKFTGSETTFPEQTFEVILMEPGYPATPTGDGEILFQYLTCSNTTDDGASNEYATVGIENLDKTDGVLYSYWNRVSPQIPGASAMGNGRAILFTTTKLPPTTPKAPASVVCALSGSNILITWEAVRRDINETPITVSGYKVYGSTNPQFVCDGTTLLASPADTFLVRTGMTDGTKFYYAVKAYTAASESNKAATVEVGAENAVIPERRGTNR